MPEYTQARGAHRWLGPGAWTLVVLLTVLLAFHTHQRVARMERTEQSPQINDFGRWLVLVPRFWHDRADFVNDEFPNPPLTMLAIVPFTKLPAATAQFLWICAKTLMASGIFVLCRRIVRRAGVELTVPAMALLLAVWLGPVIGDMQEGNTNLLMLLPLVAGLAAVQRERRGADWLGGLLVALAISIKVTPLIFLPYALLRRRWTWALAVGGGVLLWLLLIPGLVFGWHQNLRWLGQWASIMIQPYVAHGEVHLGGQSIPSLLTRLLRHVPAIVSEQGGVVEGHALNVVDLPEMIVNWISRGVLVVIGITGALWARPPLPTLRSRRYVIEIGAVAAFMLWASQRTWVPHYVTLVLTLFAVAMVASDSAEPARARRRAWLALALSAGLMALTGDAQKIIPGCGHCAKTFGVSFWASVLLVVALVTSRGSRLTHAPANPSRRPDLTSGRGLREWRR